MKYLQLAILPELETETEIDANLALENARRSIKSQLRMLSRRYKIPEYIFQLTLTGNYVSTLDNESKQIYILLFLSLIHLPE